MHCWRGCLMHSIFILTQPTYHLTRYTLNREYFTIVSTTWLAVNVITWVYLVTQQSIPFFQSPLRHLPSPKGDRFPLGHFSTRPPTEGITKMLNETPNDGLLVCWGIFYCYAEIIPTRPDILMEVMNTHNYDWEKPAANRRILSRVIGNGLVVVEGNEHKNMRRVVAPAFSGAQIRALVPLFYKKGLAFADSMAREVQRTDGDAVEVMGQMSRVTLDIIGVAGMGKDFNTIENDADPLARLYSIITQPNPGSMLLFFLVNAFLPSNWITKLKGTVYADVANAYIKLRSDVGDLMEEKKHMMIEKSEQQNDIIATIIKSGDFSNDYLVNQLLTFLAAGHDTTASALTWATYLLARHPEIQDRLRNECNTHIRNKSADDIDASIFDAETMPYLTAVCNETLRIYPTVPATLRRCIKPTTVGKLYVPQGTPTLIAIWAVNRNHDLWGKDAHVFNPNRWLDEQGKHVTSGGAKSPYSLITFLHGPRSCIGQNFARTEMKCLLAVLVNRFRFELINPGQEPEVGGAITIKPVGGLKLKLHDLKG